MVHDDSLDGGGEQSSLGRAAEDCSDIERMSRGKGALMGHKLQVDLPLAIAGLTRCVSNGTVLV